MDWKKARTVNAKCTLISIFQVALIFVVQFTWAEEDYNYSTINRYNFVLDGTRIIQNGLFAVSVPTFEQIQHDSASFHNYSQFLDYLFTKAPSLKKHFVLIDHSQSLQISSPEHPRILLYDGGQVFSFSEDPLNRYNRVEILGIDPKSHDIAMDEIIFRGNVPEFNAHPKSCIACHGSSAKPLWQPYDFWPNAFGSSIGVMSTKQETDAYDKLRATAKDSPLLNQLELLEMYRDGMQPLLEPFTEYISQINWMRWWRQYSPPQTFKYLLLAQLNMCAVSYKDKSFDPVKDRFRTFLKPSNSQEALNRLDAIYSDVKTARAHMIGYLDQMLLKIFPNPAFYRDRIDHQRLANEAYIISPIRTALDLQGVDASNLSMAPAANDYFISSPTNFAIDGLTALYESRPELFNDLKVTGQDMGEAGQNHWISLDCDQLKQKSLKEPEYSIPSSLWRPFERQQASRPPINRCIKCHSEHLNSDAPFIPFDDTRALAMRLRDPSHNLSSEIIRRINAHDSDQMPPEVHLTDVEVQAVEALINELQ
jgi:hypothetical protein